MCPPRADHRDHWDRNAARYDRATAFAERRWLAAARRWVCARAHGDVLELAVGTGANLPHYPAGVRLTGIDLSPAMIDVARAKAHATSVDLRVGDAADPPFGPASFDCVVCTFALCCVPDVDACLAAAARVLRPGGDLLLADHVASTRAWLRMIQRMAERFTVRRVGEHLTRRPADQLPCLGFEVVSHRRTDLGVIECLHARMTR